MIYPYVPQSEAGQAEYRGRTAPRDLPPPPEISSADPWPEEVPVPASVPVLAAAARSAGWRVLVQYSRGCSSRYRGAWQREELIGVRFRIGTAGTERGAFAVYRTVAGRDDWTWRNVWIWGEQLLPFGLCNITDLKEWLAACGRMPDGWYAEVTARRARQALLVKVLRCPAPPSCARTDSHEHRGDGSVRAVKRRAKEGAR